TSYNFSTNVKMYDSLGSQHNLNLYYVKTATANEWTVHAYVDGISVGTGSMTFTSGGLLSSATGLTGLSYSPTTGAASPQAFDVVMTGATQFGDLSGSASFLPDGHGAGAFSKYTIDSNGKVTALYTNGTSELVG